MNNPQNPDDGRRTEEIEALLGRVRELEPPLETRLANRTAIAEELARVQTVRLRRLLPWWRRTIPIPVPLAIGLAASVAIAFALVWHFPLENDSGELHSPNREFARAPVHSPVQLAVATSEPQYYERSVYLLGVGRISMESGYQTQE